MSFFETLTALFFCVWPNTSGATMHFKSFIGVSVHKIWLNCTRFGFRLSRMESVRDPSYFLLTERAILKPVLSV